MKYNYRIKIITKDNYYVESKSGKIKKAQYQDIKYIPQRSLVFIPFVWFDFYRPTMCRGNVTCEYCSINLAQDDILNDIQRHLKEKSTKITYTKFP